MSIYDNLYIQTDPPCPVGSVKYTIRSGDTYYTLAIRFGITVKALLAANPEVNPNRLMVGQTICIPETTIPQPPVLIPTPVCSLLQPVLAVIPPAVDIPIGSVTVRQVAMSTRAYSIVASPLPDPAMLGDYNSYIGVLRLITDNPAKPQETITIRLISSTFRNQLVTWAGTIITTYPPIVGDTVEIRPLNSVTGVQGTALLRGKIMPGCI